MKKLPIGIDNFEELISQNYYFVDKSLLIKELLDNGAKVTLIPRPRRFGKTLNLSMLQNFFEKNENQKRQLFDGLNITKHPDIMNHQGQYPVIFISFKDAKKETWEECYEKIIRLIATEFSRHKYLLDSNTLSTAQQKDFLSVINYTASKTVYESALKDLSFYLTNYHKNKPIMLIDEYDAPIQSGFSNNYYKDVINFMRGMLCAGLKDNSSLKFAVMTGILRVAKESIFSGLNNIEVCSITSIFYADKFGLTEAEVAETTKEYGLISELDKIRAWYDGYHTGQNFNVYNPWSIINFLKNKGIFQPYWLNTSDNLIIKELIENGSNELKQDIEQLLAGNNIEKLVNENIIFDSVYSQSDAVWSFLLFCGYLSFDKIYIKNELLYGSLRLPNIEVKSFYKTVVLDWIKNRVTMSNYLNMLNKLTSGNIEEFKDLFYDFTLKSLSSFDVGGDEPEKFYHALVLGMLVALDENYIIKSNREAGYGRFDLMIIPKNAKELGIIIEFKKVNKRRKETLAKAVKIALEQIEEKQYEAELKSRGITKIIKLGIAFDGKKVLVQQFTLDLLHN